jgi:hypothetical protein
MMWDILQFVILMSQAVYWFHLRNPKRDEVVWLACVYPGSSTPEKLPDISQKGEQPKWLN